MSTLALGLSTSMMNAKLQKSFQDYFRIPILLKGLGSTSQQTLQLIAKTLNQIDQYPINESYNSQEEDLKVKKSSLSLYLKLKNELSNRNSQQGQKLLFLTQDFYNQWSQFQIIYKINFTIFIYSNQDQNGQSYKQLDGGLNQKIRIKLKDQDKKLLGIIFLNDTNFISKNLVKDIKFTILPQSLPLEQLNMFIEPWIADFIPYLQAKILQQLLECKQQQNSIIVFNRSEQKSQPKIMKKKKKFRCIKICADLALSLHLYKLAYQFYNQAEEQLRKIDDFLWTLGCVQGKIACMTCNADFGIQTQNLNSNIQDLISQSFNYCKKIKNSNFQIQNFMKIIKLMINDRERFDDMIQNFFAIPKKLTEQQKFIFFSYIGSLYQRAGMYRKRNSYYYKAALITEANKPELSELLLKSIKQSQQLEKWQHLYSKILQKTIQQEEYFHNLAQMHLQLIQKCSNVLSKKQIQTTLDFLNFGNYQPAVIQSKNLIEIKQFKIQQSFVKPKPNRLMNDQSPRKTASTGIFMGWKKKRLFLYQSNQTIIFKGTIINKLPFQLHARLTFIQENSSDQIQQFGLILPANQSYKFSHLIPFSFSLQPKIIKQIKLHIFNFILYKTIDPQINFEVYQKQPNFQLQVQGGQILKLADKQKIIIQLQQSSLFALQCSLKRKNPIQFQKLRITFSVFYDIDVGFQQNQFNLTTQNSFYQLNFNHQNNITFLQSDQKQTIIDKTINNLTQKNNSSTQKNNNLILKLKQLKASRSHIKRIEINLDYIRTKISRYQINKQYTIQTKIINSLWAEIVQISTPELQKSIGKLQFPTEQQLDLFRKNWNVIEQFYLMKVKFCKDKFNLRPFKIQYGSDKQYQQVILSNLTQSQIWIKLPKIKVNASQRTLLSSIHLKMNNKQQNSIKRQNIQQNYDKEQIQQILKPIIFKWQNIVNKSTIGQIKLFPKIDPLILSPKIDIFVQLQKLLLNKQNKQNSSQNYKLKYKIKSQKAHGHKVQVKIISHNEDQSISVLIKGKTKINSLIKSQLLIQTQNAFIENTLNLILIKQKNQANYIKHKAILIVSIQFDQKEIGKYQKEINIQI